MVVETLLVEICNSLDTVVTYFHESEVRTVLLSFDVNDELALNPLELSLVDKMDSK